jgi:hypothetical protein
VKALTVVLILALFVIPAQAQSPSSTVDDRSAANIADPAQPDQAADPAPAPQAHPVATVYSDAYQTRLKIHKYASFATLPLFATEIGLGQSLYNNPNERGAVSAFHGAVAVGIVGLFAVNTVTGAWNLWGQEGKQDADNRKLKVVHGVLMMAAGGGFVATVALAPKNNRTPVPGGPITVVDVNHNRAAHRDVALASIGVGTVGYLIMLFGHH